MRVISLADIDSPANQELLRGAEIVSVTDRLTISRCQRLWGQTGPAWARVEILCNLDSPAELSRARAAVGRAKSVRLVTLSRENAPVATIAFRGIRVTWPDGSTEVPVDAGECEIPFSYECSPPGILSDTRSLYRIAAALSRNETRGEVDGYQWHSVEEPPHCRYDRYSYTQSTGSAVTQAIATASPKTG